MYFSLIWLILKLIMFISFFELLLLGVFDRVIVVGFMVLGSWEISCFKMLVYKYSFGWDLRYYIFCLSFLNVVVGLIVS